MEEMLDNFRCDTCGGRHEECNCKDESTNELLTDASIFKNQTFEDLQGILIDILKSKLTRLEAENEELRKALKCVRGLNLHLLPEGTVGRRAYNIVMKALGGK